MSIFRQASVAVRAVSRSCAFSTSSVAKKDLVQDIYIKELRSYKAPPTAKDAHVGVVKAYSLPPTPQPPALPNNLASDLSAYDASEPTTADAPKVAATTGAPTGEGAGAFLEFLEADLPKKADAHH